MTGIVSPNIADFIASNVSVVPQAASRTDCELMDQIVVANEFTKQKGKVEDKLEKKKYKKRKDVEWIPDHCSLGTVEYLRDIKSSCQWQIHHWLWYIGFAQLHAIVDDFFQQWREYNNSTDSRIWEWMYDIREQYSGSERMLVVLDKDTKRRCSMSPQGYYYRLKKGFVDDDEFYEVREHMTKEKLAKERRRRFRRYMKKRWWPKGCNDFNENNSPKAYHCYKGKCIPNPGNDLEKFCDKPHAHEREIISCAQDPSGTAISTCARALRFMVRSSGKPSWTLWRQADIVEEMRRKIKILKFRKGFERICLCGKEKLPLEAITADAAQFFKSSKTKHAVERTKYLIRDVKRKMPEA
eukprot:8588034-Lingulodinium_polyedra.AAC.1